MQLAMSVLCKIGHYITSFNNFFLTTSTLFKTTTFGRPYFYDDRPVAERLR